MVTEGSRGEGLGELSKPWKSVVDPPEVFGRASGRSRGGPRGNRGVLVPKGVEWHRMEMGHGGPPKVLVSLEGPSRCSWCPPEVLGDGQRKTWSRKESLWKDLGRFGSGPKCFRGIWDRSEVFWDVLEGFCEVSEGSWEASEKFGGVLEVFGSVS